MPAKRKCRSSHDDEGLPANTKRLRASRDNESQPGKRPRVSMPKTSINVPGGRSKKTTTDVVRNSKKISNSVVGEESRGKKQKRKGVITEHVKQGALTRNGLTSREKSQIEDLEGKGLIHPVLSTFYCRVFTLREYVLSRWTGLSQRRRGVIGGYGFPRKQARGSNTRKEAQAPLFDPELKDLLDTTLIGVAKESNPKPQITECDLKQYSQSISVNGSVKQSQPTFSQSEVVDYATWRLFNVAHPYTKKPPHVLCHGMQRAAPTLDNGMDVSAACNVPGLTRMQPNEHVERIKASPWSDLLNLLGKDGPLVMIHLIVECGIFVPLDRAVGNLLQLSGVPLPDLQNMRAREARQAASKSGMTMELATPRKPNEIRFVRSRIFYAKAALNAKGHVAFGLRHIHVLSRYPNSCDKAQTLQVARYIFPRQFGLHNVFTSKTDSKETSQAFKDYTMREQEITQHLAARNDSARLTCPKRLRPAAIRLISRLQKLHTRCPYVLLFRYYCPLPDWSMDVSTQPSTPQPEFTSLATPHRQVSAFCRSVISRVFPRRFLGEAEAGNANWTVLMRNVDAFICARRYESLTLESVMHGLNVKCIEWLRPQGIKVDQKMAQSDFQKRKELLLEFLYYVFDSFLIPIIRTNFYVTESNKGKNRLFYFRHDVWRRLSEPAIASLKTCMFEEVPSDKAQKILASRMIGANKIRLLPKATTMRTIMNLKRRTQLVRHGAKVLGRSTNSVVAPSFHVLNRIKMMQPELLGSSMFSVADMYGKIRDFRQALSDKNILPRQRLYFVSVDVSSCFDNLPQDNVVEHVKQLLSASEYSISNHDEYGPLHGSNAAVKAKRTFRSLARDFGDVSDFAALLDGNVKKKSRGSVLVDGVVQQQWDKTQIVDLLREHVQHNIVTLGKKFYRQKRGIPQGSVLSTILCSLLYAKFERERLRFLSKAPHLLLRLIDDFLFITTDPNLAREFLQTMYAGSGEYGIEISRHKSLANFDVQIGGQAVTRTKFQNRFPYCGIMIDTRSLDICKDAVSNGPSNVTDSLSVEYSKAPGLTLRRKLVSILKIQMHAMLLDTSHNASVTVVRNLFCMFSDVASKAFHYLAALPSSEAQLGNSISGLVSEASELAVAMMHGRRRRVGTSGYKCAIKAVEVRWIAAVAFTRTLRRKQTKYTDALSWLVSEISRLEKGISGKGHRGRRMAMLRAAVASEHSF